ncbi:MAG: sigma-70 family RNA polymerase sigma factor [Candidatus Melainabacteria bacterium]|nr:sigma-70 family RNA polymerase sigma factor [Candidatus Melainabacteria bacterium]
MALLPSKDYSQHAAASVLIEVRKGNKQALGDFIWQNQERIYAIAYLATNDVDMSTQLTMMAFKNAFVALKQLNPKQLGDSAWDWLAQFIVDACAEYHMEYSGPVPANAQADPSVDGSAQMDWESTIILGLQRMKRCLGTLPDEQKNVFLLRHQLGLNYEQVAQVLNKNVDDVLAWLFRSRVQVIKCLGRG